MVITQDWVDTVCPEHGRTSCSDDNLSNRHGGWTGYFSRKTGAKEIRIPRCNRCYLMDNIGMDTDDLEFRIFIDVSLVWKG